MSQPSPQSFGESSLDDVRAQLELYLDGMLEGEALHRFERVLETDASLRKEVEAQRSINDSLSRLFRCEDGVELPQRTPEVVVTPTIQPPALRLAGSGGAAAGANEAAPRKEKRRLVFPLVGLAASLLVAFIGVYSSGLLQPPSWLGGGVRGLMEPAEVYQGKIASGFTPEWVCENDEQFIKTTQDRWGDKLLVRSTGDVKVVGWSYYNDRVFSHNTAALLTYVKDTPVIVLMDHKSKDRKFSLPKDSGLKDFRRVVGDIVMHEITPLDEPRVIGLAEEVE